MTNAIEQAKREMYRTIGVLKIRIGSMISESVIFQNFESALEAYLELLRQDHEALHETARKRFEDIQALEMKNDAQREIIEGAGGTNDLSYRLAKMTEERDSLRNRMQAYEARELQAGTSCQTSGDRASCATPDANTDAILKAVVDVRRIATDWALNGLRAKTAIRAVSAIVNGKASVLKAMHELEKPATCMHSFFAIGQDQMKCTFCGVGK